MCGPLLVYRGNAGGTLAMLGAMCGVLNSLAQLAKTHSVFDSDTCKAWSDVARLGNRTVALTFCLFHIVVQFPRIKGITHQRAAADQLKKEVGNSEFKEAWTSLPKCVRDAVEGFGH